VLCADFAYDGAQMQICASGCEKGGMLCWWEVGFWLVVVVAVVQG